MITTSPGVTMRLFILMFILVYGSTHLYFFLKVKAAFSPSFLTSAMLSVFLLLMVIAPVFIRFLENHEFEVTARIVAYIGYLWMGFLFLCFSASIAIDIYHVMIRGMGFVVKRDVLAFLPSQRTALLLSLAWGITTTAYGFIEALNVRTERVVIETAKVPASVGKITIAQISDVHLGLIIRSERLKRIIAEIDKASPDILVSTGDLVDGQINRMVGIAELLQNVHPRLGKFAVIGNHEVYAGLDQALDFIQRAGFRILRNEIDTVGGIIQVAGVDDPVIERITHTGVPSEQALLTGHTADGFTLLLKHRPVIDPESIGRFDLQLSGHVHKGQIFPFNFLTRLSFPIETGLTEYPQNSRIYVSRGTGTWGPPIRFLAPPEVTIIELRHTDSGG
jgi:predicted MPP superfamily phosphohydrolase